MIADAPELRLEEVWLPESKTVKDPTKKERGTFDVRLICHIHANPPAKVVQADLSSVIYTNSKILLHYEIFLINKDIFFNIF